LAYTVRMEWLNYNHLFYFWTVVREGGLTQAGRALRLSHPTLSAQVHALEDRVGHKLLLRVGRRLQPTEVGRLVYGYAEEIFSLGREMLDAVQGRPAGGALRLQVGVVDAVPKLIVRRLLQPALRLAGPVRLVCHEDSYEKLLSELALYNLDVVIADGPVPSGSAIRAFSHSLGECGVGIFGSPALARKHREGFPRSLEGAPMLLPLPGSPLRRALDQWFDANQVRPRIVAEFEDRALLNVFGADGAGLFPAPLAVQREVRKQHGVSMAGQIPQVRERFYAVSVQRRLKHPAVVAITEAARAAVFAE
jgi:LysR family transcriptional regulator, transcriptional activator of nhaA